MSARSVVSIVPILTSSTANLDLPAVSGAVTAAGVVVIAVITSATTAASAAVFARACFVDDDVTSVIFLTVKLRDGRAGGVLVNHFDKPKPRPADDFISSEINLEGLSLGASKSTKDFVMDAAEAAVGHNGDDIAVAELGCEVFDDGIGVRK